MQRVECRFQTPIETIFVQLQQPLLLCLKVSHLLYRVQIYPYKHTLNLF